jgi:hypothetical protein
MLLIEENVCCSRPSGFGNGGADLIGDVIPNVEIW